MKPIKLKVSNIRKTDKGNYELTPINFVKSVRFIISKYAPNQFAINKGKIYVRDLKHINMDMGKSA